MNTKKLAELIYSVAQYDGYNTSILQTQKNLSSNKEEWQFTNENDRYIFEDLVKAIHYASNQSELTVEVFKGINAQMDSHKEGQPDEPGQLRHKVEIHLGDYIPPRTVTEKMVQREISAVKGVTVEDGWELYARLAKLQAFDNGNKRTALISANLLIGSLKGETQTFLTIPTDFRRTQFDANLMYFYMADDFDDHLPDVQYSLKEFVRFAKEYTKTQSKNKFEERLKEAKIQQTNQKNFKE
ncbi:Fic family protein [Enterococcus faecalis]|uniref:Fic family protein n=1 Tax=Enterococcus faecalis TaxID=1351 RepID=UPI004041D2B4